ncbi:MAG: cell division protein FtsA [Bacilli bacterium]
MKNVFASIDVGSDSIKVVVCTLQNNKLNLLATSSVKSKGIKKGLIVDAEKAQASVKEAMDEIQKMLGIKIKQIIASIPANFADFTFVKGEVRIVNEIVKSDDIVKVLQQSAKTKLTPEKEMVTIIPIDFKLDDAEGIQNPLGHKAKVLSTRAIMVTAPKKNIISVVSIIESLGVEVIDFMINSIGTINALKTKEMDKEAGSIINIGAETMNVSLYNKGTIVKNSIIGVGSGVIETDIAKTYDITLNNARKIKERFAVADKKFASNSEFYEVTTKDSKKIKISQLEVSTLVSNRYLQLIELAVKEISSLSGKQLDYLIFTGGATNAFHFDTLIEEKLGKKAKVGKTKIVGLRNNQNTAAVGNIIYFINKLKLKGTECSMLSTSDLEDLSSVRKNTANISSDSMLNKVVSYFFGE